MNYKNYVELKGHLQNEVVIKNGKTDNIWTINQIKIKNNREEIVAIDIKAWGKLAKFLHFNYQKDDEIEIIGHCEFRSKKLTDNNYQKYAFVIVDKFIPKKVSVKENENQKNNFFDKAEFDELEL